MDRCSVRSAAPKREVVNPSARSELVWAGVAEIRDQLLHLDEVLIDDWEAPIENLRSDRHLQLEAADVRVDCGRSSDLRTRQASIRGGHRAADRLADLSEVGWQPLPGEPERNRSSVEAPLHRGEDWIAVGIDGVAGDSALNAIGGDRASGVKHQAAGQRGQVLATSVGSAKEPFVAIVITQTRLFDLGRHTGGHPEQRDPAECAHGEPQADGCQGRAPVLGRQYFPADRSRQLWTSEPVRQRLPGPPQPPGLTWSKSTTSKPSGTSSSSRGAGGCRAVAPIGGRTTFGLRLVRTGAASSRGAGEAW